jgi:hypothetical protein
MRTLFVAAALAVAGPAAADGPYDLDTWLHSLDEVGLFRAEQMHAADDEPPPETRARAAEVRRAPPRADLRDVDEEAPPRDGDEADAVDGAEKPSPEAEDATDGDDVDAVPVDG